MAVFSIPSIEEKRKRDKKLINQAKTKSVSSIDSVSFADALTRFSQEELNKYTTITDAKELSELIKNINFKYIVLQPISLLTSEKKNTFFGLAISFDDKNLFINKSSLKTSEMLSEITKLAKYQLIGQKVSKNINILRKELNLEVKYYWDVYIAAKLLNENEKSYDSFNLCKKYSLLNDETFSKLVLSNLQYCVKKEQQYCSNISENILSLFKFQYKHLVESGKKDMTQLYELFVNIEMPCTLAIANMEFRGVAIDKALFSKLYEKYEKLYHTSKNTGAKDTTEYSKMLSSIFEPISESIISNKVYTTFDQYGAVTGRISSSSPNLQSFPSKGEHKEIRQIVKAKDNYVLISSDFSSQEPRLTAQLCKDDNLLEIFNNNLDIYSKIASTVLNTEYENCLEYNSDGTINKLGQKNRTLGKILWLCTLYGMSEESLSNKLHCTVEFAKKIQTNLFKAFPKLVKYINWISAFSEKNHFVVSLYGRKRRFPELKNDRLSIQEKAKIQRQGINAVIQCSGADMLKKAIVDIDNDKQLKELGYELLFPIHDELIGQCPKENIDKCTKRVQYLMNNCVKDKVSIPIKSDIKIFEHWDE